MGESSNATLPGGDVLNSRILPIQFVTIREQLFDDTLGSTGLKVLHPLLFARNFLGNTTRLSFCFPFAAISV
jgi:hypothetical protein